MGKAVVSFQKAHLTKEGVRQMRISTTAVISATRLSLIVNYTVCVPQQKTRTYTVTRTKCVLEEKTQTYTVSVPVQVEKQVNVRVCKMVPKEIQRSVGNGCGAVSAAGNGGCNGCSAAPAASNCGCN